VAIAQPNLFTSSLPELYERFPWNRSFAFAQGLLDRTGGLTASPAMSPFLSYCGTGVAARSVCSLKFTTPDSAHT
jgi:hypothetical protein